jgi:hypothetical protein
VTHDRGSAPERLRRMNAEHAAHWRDGRVSAGPQR